jgi:hypothetical protein
VGDSLDELMDDIFYTHLDLAHGLWQARVREEDVHKTTFQTHDGMMECVNMPFGLCNAHATFQWMMNDILREFLHMFVTIYLDDVYLKMKMICICYHAHSRRCLRAFLNMPSRTWNTKFRPGGLLTHPLRRCCGALLPPRRILAG